MGFSKSKSEHASKKKKKAVFFFPPRALSFSFALRVVKHASHWLNFENSSPLSLSSFFSFNWFTSCHLNPVGPLSPNNSFLQTDIDTAGVVDSNRLMVEDPFMWAQWPQNIPEHHHYVQTDSHECIPLILFPNFNFIQTPIALIHEYLIAFLIFPLTHLF